ncbi:MAG: hypothetical protein ACO31I_16735 [Prochlorotrichaceae cyanobacterium]
MNLYLSQVNSMHCIEIVKQALENFRSKHEDTAAPTIVWKGYHMTKKEACVVIQALEHEKSRLKEWHRNTTTGADVTKTVGKGLSEGSKVAAKGMGVFMPLVGNLLSDIASGIEEMGNKVGEGIQGINEARHLPMFDELDQNIDSLNQAIKGSAS